MKHILRCFSTSLVAMLAMATVASAQDGTSTQGFSVDGTTLTLGSFDEWPDLSSYKDVVTKVVFSDDFKATTIGESAFYWFPNLEEVATIPDCVESIEFRAFFNCTSLTKVTLPQGKKLTTLKDEAFFGCDFTSIELPATLTTIGQSVFKMCNSLEEIVIPEGVTTIKNETFWRCSKLKKVTLPASLTQICDAAFWDCSSLEEVVISKGTQGKQSCIVLGSSSPTEASIGKSMYYYVFPTNITAKLTYYSETLRIGETDEENLRYYFHNNLNDLSKSATSLQLAPVTSSHPQYYDLSGRKVNPDTYKGVAVKVQNGSSTLTTIK